MRTVAILVVLDPLILLFQVFNAQLLVDIVAESLPRQRVLRVLLTAAFEASQPATRVTSEQLNDLNDHVDDECESECGKLGNSMSTLKSLTSGKKGPRKRFSPLG